MTAAVALNIEGENIAIRPAVEDDYGFIIDSWLRGFERASASGRELYKSRQPTLIKSLLGSPANRTMVACSEDVESTIFGWICGSYGKDFIHYGFVRGHLRGQGIARSLVQASLGHYPKRIYVTHRFANGKEGRNRFIFNPYLLQVLF